MQPLVTLSSAVLLGALSLQSVAAIVDSADQSYFTETTKGLDWLDVTATVGMSVNQVNDLLGAGQQYEGWRYATNLEFEDLIFAISGQGPCLSFGCTTGHTGNLMDTLIDLFGSTIDAYAMKHYGATFESLLGYAPGTGPNETFGLLRYGAGYTAATLFDNADNDSPGGYSVSNGPYNTAALNEGHRGNYLVRASSTPESGTAIPEPGTLPAVLAGLGLMGAMALRRR